MTRRTAVRLAGISVIVVVLSGCSADVDPTPPTVTATPTATATASGALTTAQARAELQAYLDAWRTDGPASASRAYLATDQQVASDADAPQLRSGTVTAVTDDDTTPEGQRFRATLELSFDGDPVAWTEGTNDRLVTFTRRDGDIPYEMAFATGP